jgi:hypothetical protein
MWFVKDHSSFTSVPGETVAGIVESNCRETEMLAKAQEPTTGQSVEQPPDPSSQ